MRWIRFFGVMLGILSFVFLAAIVAEVQAQTPTSSQAQPYPTWDQYYQLQAERDACCNAPPGVPMAYNNTTASSRPIAKPVTGKCVPVQQKTDLDRRRQNYTYDMPYAIKLYAVKIAAVKENSTSGGVPADCWITIQFGTYVSAQGYYGVFTPVRNSRAEAEKDMRRCMALGYCNTKIYELVITGNIEVPLYASEGTYVQRE